MLLAASLKPNGRKNIKNKLKISIFIIVLSAGIIAILLLLYNKFVLFPIKSNSLVVLQTKYDNNSIYFYVAQKDTGYFISKYNYRVLGNNTVEVLLWGTCFEQLSYHSPDNLFIIPEIDDTYTIKLVDELE